MLQPKVGDTVVCEFEVIYTALDSFKYKTIDGCRSAFVNNRHIMEIKPAPFEVGDNVWWVGNNCGFEPYERSSARGGTLLYIHDLDGRKFAVVAYGGDMPRSIWFKDLRRSFTECVG